MLRIIIYFVEAMASNFNFIFLISHYCDVAQVAIVHNNIKPIFVEKS
jgi:hypothetical protein